MIDDDDDDLTDKLSQIRELTICKYKSSTTLRQPNGTNLRQRRALDRSKQVRVVSLQSIKERGRYSNTDLSGVFKVRHRMQRSMECVPRVCLYLSTRCKRSASRVCARERVSSSSRQKEDDRAFRGGGWIERERERLVRKERKEGARERIRRTERKVRKEEKGREKEREGGIPREQYCDVRVYIACTYTLRRVTHCAHAGARTRDRHRDT